MTEKCKVYEVETRLISSERADREIERLRKENNHLRSKIKLAVEQMYTITEYNIDGARKNYGAISLVRITLMNALKRRWQTKDEDDIPF